MLVNYTVNTLPAKVKLSAYSQVSTVKHKGLPFHKNRSDLLGRSLSQAGLELSFIRLRGGRAIYYFPGCKQAKNQTQTKLKRPHQLWSHRRKPDHYKNPRLGGGSALALAHHYQPPQLKSGQQQQAPPLQFVAYKWSNGLV